MVSALKRPMPWLLILQALCAYLAWPNYLLPESNILSALLVFLVPMPTFMIMLRYQGREAYRWCGLSGLAMFLIPATLWFEMLPSFPLATPLIFLFLAAMVYGIFGNVGLWAGACIRRFPAWYLLFAPANFAAFEFLRLVLTPKIWFFPPPILLYAYPLAGLPPLMQMASLTGVLGADYFVLCVAAGLALLAWRFLRAWDVRRPEPVLAGKVPAAEGRPLLVNSLMAAVLGLGFAALIVAGNLDAAKVERLQSQAERSLRPALLQGQFDAGNYGEWSERIKQSAIVLFRRLALNAKADRAELLVFTESALPLTLPSTAKVWRDFQDILEEAGVPAIIGLVTALDSERRFNVWYLVDAKGKIRDYYLKQYLIPFGEYMPGRPLVNGAIRLLNRVFATTYELLKLTSVDEDMKDLSPGSASKVFQLPQGAVILRVCEEIMFPQYFVQGVRLGGEVILNAGTGNWFPTPVFFNMRLQMACFRAVETRRWVGLVSSTASAAYVDPLGLVRDRAPFGQRAALVKRLPLLNGKTVYVRCGDWMGWLVLGLTAVLVAMMAWSWGRERFSKSGQERPA
ncbi:MAG: apolipoprotein N-acyltransferase [candidate division FCPU426 bacterium]